MKANSLVIGADIGGTHITAGLVNLDTRTFVKGTETRYSINSNGSAEQILEGWTKAIARTRAMAKNVDLVGIAIPGPFDYYAGISLMAEQHKFGSLYSTNVKIALAELLDIDEQNIKFRNDAEAFLEGEVFCGAGFNYKKVFGLTLGTGLGSARWMSGVCEDASLWNVPFMNGIAEDYFSARWFIKRYRELSGIEVNNAKTLADQHHENRWIQQLFREFSYHLAEFFASFVQPEEPELIIIGGNISNAFPLFEEDLRKYMPRSMQCDIKVFELGEHAALIGAACLWERITTPVS
jgi:glucokinase